MISDDQRKISATAILRNRTFGIWGLFILAFLVCALAQGNRPAHAADPLADTPLLALIKSAPANIMVVLDDSGSMTFEILVKGEYDGQYPNPDDTAGTEGYCYIFPDLGDNNYSDAWRYMPSDRRKYWKSQHFRDNVMYYNPGVDYKPWISYTGQTYGNANSDEPLPHPTKSGTTALKLDDPAFTVIRKIDATTEENMAISYAHYFTQPEGVLDPYLVVFSGGSIKYYQVIETTGVDFTETVTRIEQVSEASLPEGIKSERSYGDERQNFANWFTYHRKREYTAKYAVAQVVERLEGVRMGILGINGKIIVPLQPVLAKIEGVVQNEKDALLEELYAYDSRGGTPLREGLNDVGKYLAGNSETLHHFGGGKATGDL